MAMQSEMVVLDVMNNVEATIDDNLTPASIAPMYSHPPTETLKQLFFNEDYDVVIIVGDAEETSSELKQQTATVNAPLRYLARIPVTVYTTDKEEFDLVVATGRIMQNKLRAAMREEVEEASMNETHNLSINPRTAPAYTRQNGYPLWTREYTVEYREYHSRAT